MKNDSSNLEHECQFCYFNKAGFDLSIIGLELSYGVLYSKMNETQWFSGFYRPSAVFIRRAGNK